MLPEINLKVRGGDGELLRRCDLAWPQVWVIVEYNGKVHYTDRATRNKDIADRVWKVLAERGLDGLPVRPSDAWLPYFPGR